MYLRNVIKACAFIPVSKAASRRYWLNPNPSGFADDQATDYHLGARTLDATLGVNVVVERAQAQRL
jgi:hypothetical protein